MTVPPAPRDKPAALGRLQKVGVEDGHEPLTSGIGGTTHLHLCLSPHRPSD
jgi:hypothetical protein